MLRLEESAILSYREALLSSYHSHITILYHPFEYYIPNSHVRLLIHTNIFLSNFQATLHISSLLCVLSTPFSVPSFYRSKITNFEARYQIFSSLLLLPPTTLSNRAEHRNILQGKMKNMGSHFRFWQPKIRYINNAQ